MIGICAREFQSLIKSIKSIIIIVIIAGVTLMTAKFLKGFEHELANMGISNVYAGGLFALLLIFGPLFVTSLSHDIINKETQSRTMRFLVTKISRDKIILGKFMGVSLFWFVCLTVALLFILPVTKSFYFKELIEATIFITYFVGLFLFLSTVIGKTALSMFIGIILSIAIPVIGFWSLASDSHLAITILSYLTPYYYFGDPERPYLAYFVPVLTFIFILGSVMIFRKRDC
jgi:ABC-2 type transport system permease protein